MKRFIISFTVLIIMLLLVACNQDQQLHNGGDALSTSNPEIEDTTPTTDQTPSIDKDTPIVPPSENNVHTHIFNNGKCNSCEIAPINTWDISQKGDGSLKAFLYQIESNYTLEIAGTGEMLEQDYNEFMPWRQYRDKITKIVFNGSLTHISRQAFNGLAITSLELPNTLQYIGEEAFSACSELTNVTIPANVMTIDRLAFFMCTKLKIVDIPLATQVIGINAFQYCPELTTVTFGKNTSSRSATLTIKDGAFSSCGKITNFALPNHTIQVGVDAFKDVPETLFEYDGNLAYLGKWLIKPQMSNIQNVNIKDSCIGIADGAFENCDNLKSISVPNSVSFLGASVFRNCDLLESVLLPISITEIKSATFYSCKKLTEVNIPKYTTSIGTHAFYDCDSLKGIIIPVEIRELGASAFYSCDSLEQLAIISQSINNIGSHCFYDCNELKYISYSARQEHWEQTTIEQGNSPLTNASIIFNVAANHLHSIVSTEAVEPTCHSKGFSSSAYCSECSLTFVVKEDLGTLDHEYDENDFCSCGQKKPTDALVFEITYYNSAYKVMGITDTTITDIVIPMYYNGLPVIEIDYEAFKGNRNIKSVYIPSTVKVIGQSAFDGCKNLESITLTEGLETIGNFAFSDCVDLSSIILPQSLKEIGSFAFVDCTLLDNVTLPSNLEILGPAAFQKCSSLKIITIPNKIKGIESNTFAFCSSLTSVEMHDGIAYIDEWAFYCCDSLTEFSLPESVEWIGESCFAYCEELVQVTLNEKLDEIDQQAFQGCRKLVIVKYKGSITAWTSVELNEYWNRNTGITKIECSDGEVEITSST